MTDESGEYGGGLELTCILYQGAQTLTTTGTVTAAGKNLEPTIAFAAAISEGDYVGLFRDTANTADATGFLPVVTTVAAATGIIGRVISTPRWVKFPQATTVDWATDLSLNTYMIAKVEFMMLTSAHVAATEGDTDLLVGAPVKWDLSLNAYVDAGTTNTGAISFHYYATATTTTNGLIGFGGGGVSATTADMMMCIDVIA